MHAQILTAILFCCLPLLHVSSVAADCLRPVDVPDNVFALSSALAVYATGYVYEVVCVPGYSPTSVTQLVCEHSGAWRGSFPDCQKDETKARWWILLLFVTATIILVPCITPRIYFHFVDCSHGTNLDTDSGVKAGDVELTAVKWKPSIVGTEMRDTFDIDKKARKVTAKPVAYMGPEVYLTAELQPKPLPPIRSRQKWPASPSDLCPNQNMVGSVQRSGQLSPITSPVTS